MSVKARLGRLEALRLKHAREGEAAALEGLRLVGAEAYTPVVTRAFEDFGAGRLNSDGTVDALQTALPQDAYDAIIQVVRERGI